MKIKLLDEIINSTLSCISKCLRFLGMIHKKIIFGFFTLSFLAGCTSPTAMLGPAYTFSSTGNIFQAGLSYGSNQMITMYTGKTPMENVIEITSNDKKNIQKKTLESEDFKDLVISRVKKTNRVLKSSNQ